MYGDMKEDFEIEDSQKVCCHIGGNVCICHSLHSLQAGGL